MTGCDCNPREATLNERLDIICAECGAILEPNDKGGNDT